MAESEELRINVKVDNEKAAENTKQLKNAFASITDIAHVQGMEKLRTQLRLSDEQFKKLAEVVAKPTDAINAFATGFGRGGAALLAIQAAIKVAEVASHAFTSAAGNIMDITNAAKRMGNIHPRQLEENVEMLHRLGIGRGQAIQMFETLNDRILKFRDVTTGFRQDLLKDVAQPSIHIAEQHLRQLDEVVGDPTEFANRVRRYADEIEKEWTRRGDPQKGAEEKRKYLDKFFGAGGMERVTQDFVKVSREAELAWDRNQRAAQEWLSVTADIKNNFTQIVGSVLANVMDEMKIGTLLRFVNASLERIARAHWDPDLAPELQQQRMRDLIAENNANIWNMVLEFLRGSGGKITGETEEERKAREEMLIRLRPQPGGGGAATRLFDQMNDNQLDIIVEEKKLVDNLQFINAVLAGEGEFKGGMSKFTPRFHNSPQGGAKGESNPIQLPPSEKQPGGGAAAEARKGAGRDRYGPLGTQNPYDPIQAKESTVFYTGEKGQKSVTYTDPATGKSYTDRTKPIGPPTSGLPHETPGIAFGFRNFPQRGRETLGGYYIVTPQAGPNVGKSFILPHADLGPGAGAQKLDYNAPASMMVYGNYDPTGGTYAQYVGKNLPEGVLPGELTKDQLELFQLGKAHQAFVDDQYNKRMIASTGGGWGSRTAREGDGEFKTAAELQEELRNDAMPRGMDLEFDPMKNAPTRTASNEQGTAQTFISNYGPQTPAAQSAKQTLTNVVEDILETHTPKDPTNPGNLLLRVVPPGLREIPNIIRKDAERGNPLRTFLRDKLGIDDPDKPKLRSEEADREALLEHGRRRLDQEAAHDVDAKARLNVDVDAPRGTEVTADGDGMFKNGVSVNRTVQNDARQ